MQYKAPDHGFDYDYFVIGGGSGGVLGGTVWPHLPLTLAIPTFVIARIFDDAPL
jgi:hypothetical protein